MLVEPRALTQQLNERLSLRHAELSRLLQAAAGAAVGAADEMTEVRDFKDAAAEESQVAVEDAALASAASELAQVAAALRRLDDGSYGFCEDCGDPIDERRLLAMPATLYCTSCQTVRESRGLR